MGLGIWANSPARRTNTVRTGSLAAARRKASRASGSSTPSSSKRMRPGWMRTPHHSTPPLPLPMRTSMGFLVTGTSGKTRIQRRPTRFMWRVTARRAASIWRAERRPGEVALRP